jgi:hypothetical protein
VLLRRDGAASDGLTEDLLDGRRGRLLTEVLPEHTCGHLVAQGELVGVGVQQVVGGVQGTTNGAAPMDRAARCRVDQ